MMENCLPSIEEALALPFSLSSSATPNFSTALPDNAPNWPTSSKRWQLSPKEWEELKPAIQQLYIDEGKTFKEVAVALQVNYNFSPTKKQFGGQIKKWELRKNATRSQRALIIGELHNDDDAKTLKETSLKLNPGKVQRWEREQEFSGSLGKTVRSAVALSTPKVAAQRLSESALSPLREILEMSVATPKTPEQSQTIWDKANIPGSPNLKGIFTALKIDAEYPIPPSFILPPRDPEFITQDQWSDLVTRPIDESANAEAKNSNSLAGSSRRGQRDLKSPVDFIWKRLLSRIEKPWTPLNEIHPFPVIAKTYRTKSGTYIEPPPWKTRRIQITQSEGRIQKMQKVFPPENPGLLAEMDHLAELYFLDGRIEPAESLYQSVALARYDALGSCYIDTLWAHFKFIRVQSIARKSEALNLQQDLNKIIQKLLKPGHRLAIISRSLLADLLFETDEKEEAEILYREVLQITLNEFGQKHEITLRAMRDMSNMMRYHKQYEQSERLLRTDLQILSHVARGVQFELHNSKTQLSEVLKSQGRYTESCSLAKNALRLSMSLYGMESEVTQKTIRLLASLHNQMGEFDECEILVRGNVWRREQVLDISSRSHFLDIHELAGVMVHTGCWTEATNLYEHLFRHYWENKGPDDHPTVSRLERLGLCYSMQGLYNEPAALAARLMSVLERKEAIFAGVWNLKRKYRQPRVEEVDDDSVEVEEVRPFKKRLMTCTYNLKVAHG